MQYYILMPGDKETELSDANLLGESSFDTFWGGGGLKILMKLVDRQPEVLPNVTIKTDANKIITIDQFLTDIGKLKIRY
jgi:hypothetical protein